MYCRLPKRLPQITLMMHLLRPLSKLQKIKVPLRRPPLSKNLNRRLNKIPNRKLKSSLIRKSLKRKKLSKRLSRKNLNKKSKRSLNKMRGKSPNRKSLNKKRGKSLNKNLPQRQMKSSRYRRPRST